MVINLITFASILHKQASVRSSHEVILTELEKYFTVNFIDYKDIDKLSPDDFSIIFIATGGVERLVIQHFESLPRPAILLADGMQNSLAAALEISSWLRGRGMKSEILHGELPETIKRIFVLHSNFVAQRSLFGMRIGVMGTPSSWLVASNVDYLLAKRRWGIEFIDIPMEEVYCLFYQIKDDDIGYEASVFANRAIACREGTPEDLLKAMRLYQAVKIICEKKKLDAVTLSCFSLIEKLGTTGCLALALLNDEGIPAGCEGDLQSIFTLLIAKTLTGQAGFMANPAFINDDLNEIVMAHCTIATKMVDQFIIRNHFETETGIAIQGILHPGGITMIKCAGECLDEYFVSTGQLIENTNYINACRTQARIKLDKSVDYFMRNPLGNHHIILMGDHEKVIHEFMQLNSCKLVE